ncbi:MAG: hypothetical protein GXO45_02835 [Aquificae bacterium]|nr:hypothetical protein [Aquificota bacterium]
MKRLIYLILVLFIFSSVGYTADYRIVFKSHKYKYRYSRFLFDIFTGLEGGYLKENFKGLSKGDGYIALKGGVGFGYRITVDLYFINGIEGRWILNKPHLITNRYPDGNYMSLSMGDLFTGILYRDLDGFIFKLKFVLTKIDNDGGTTFASGGEIFTGKGIQFSVNKEFWKRFYAGVEGRFTVSNSDASTENTLYNYGLGLNLGWVFY